MIIKNVKFSYIDVRYMLGPFIDFISELEVDTADYDNIVATILKKEQNITDIKVLSFQR